jgi:hypothetical protein
MTEHGRNMLVADSHTAFTEACVLLALDNAQRKALGNAAHKTIVDNYSWNSVLKPLQQALASTKVANENLN